MSRSSQSARAASRRLVPIASTVLTLSACQETTASAERRCPDPFSDFPNDACAVIRGRALDSVGVALAGAGVRVDSLYVSQTAAVGPSGAFDLKVTRVFAPAVRITPDTATVDLKLFPEATARQDDPPIARAKVLVEFAPLGQPVRVTDIDVQFPVRRAR